MDQDYYRVLKKKKKKGILSGFEKDASGILSGFEKDASGILSGSVN